MTDTETGAAEPIAIVGMACRVPGAGNVTQFWENLVDGVESVHLGTIEEHLAAGVLESEARDPDFVPVSAVLAEAQYFDAGMFAMTAVEAELRDPQHRLFLELSYTALEDSGYDPHRFRGDIGVYAGMGEDGYQWRNVRRNRAVLARSGPLGLSVNSRPDYLSTLTSYKLGLRGPSLTVHTACSTSLVAVHLACEALRNGECDMALAGTANVDLPLGGGYVYIDGGPSSKDGHCRAFDASATGTVWSSGGAVVILKRVRDAITAADDIRAVIVGNAINNDGETKVGFTAPSQRGQAAVIAQALAVADVDPRTIGFVEAHGTGTVLGDPIEVAALTSVYQRDTEDRGWCALGSVKTNIGHLGPAAGVAGLIKAVLAVRNEVIPPSLNYQVPNPEIDFGTNPFYVNTTPSAWLGKSAPRRAAVSSFGMGGTNAHVIIEQAPPRQVRSARQGWQLIHVSARTETALASSATALADHLDAAGPASDHALADVAYTLRVGRQQLPRRLAVVAADEADAAKALRRKRRWITGSVGRAVPQPVFLFPGQGAQYTGMGAGLYADEPVYRDAVDECCAVFRGVGTGLLADGRLDLREFLVAAGGDEALRQTVLAQPALFTVEYALAALWRSWGVTPRAMIGHSIGEFVAATYAGVFELEDALRVIARRAGLMQSLPAGAMVAVQLDEAELRRTLPEGASIAAVNGPGACVVSGPGNVIDDLIETLDAADIGARRLHTSHAFHSAMMDPVLSEFRDVLAAVELKPPRSPFASSRTGKWITPVAATDPSYWARQLRDTVRFSDCVDTVAGADSTLFLECGPGRQLSGLIRMQRRGHTAIPCLPGPGETGTDMETLAAAIGSLWVNGCDLDAEAIGTPGNRVPLPTYPWEREYRWVQADPGVALGAQPVPDRRHAARSSTQDGLFAVPVWRQLPPLGQHQPPPRVLMLDGDNDFVAVGLAARGCHVVRVRRGTHYESGSDSYRVRPASREDYEALFADLSARGGIPAHIVHCWTVPDVPANGAQAVWAAQDDGFFSVLSLVQALAGMAPDGSVHLDVVTAGTQGAVGRDLSRPEHATLAGAVKVLPREFPWLSARHIDADPDISAQVTAADGTSLATAVIDEICDHVVPSDAVDNQSEAHPDEPLVALRNGRRWHRRFETIAAPQAAEGERSQAVLSEQGVYLITGGLGGIGITLAEDLATRFQARLVLVAREKLPPRHLWDAAGALDAASPRARRAIAAIRRMEQARAEVHVVAADVADPIAARALHDEVISRYGHINGIIHAAGVAGGGMAEIKDSDVARNVLRPKVAGTLALRDAFADQVLDFVALFSSVRAVAGGFGQVDYCAANAFLDAHAGGDHGWNARVVSVNWGTWLTVGMTAEVSVPAAFRALQRGERMLPVRHGLLTQQHPAQGDTPAWCSGTVSPETHWLLADHRLAGPGVAIMPGTAYLEAARCAFAECHPSPGPEHVVELRDVVLTQPLAVPDGASAELRVILMPTADGAEFEVSSIADDAVSVHARGDAAWIKADAEPAADIGAIRKRCPHVQPPSGPNLITFGSHWENLIRVHGGRNEELALLELKQKSDEDPYPWTIQPALLDEAVTSDWSGATAGFLPFGYGRVVVRRALPAHIWSHRRYQDAAVPGVAATDITVYDKNGGEVLRIEDLSMRKADVASLTDAVTARAAPEATADAIAPATGAEAFRRLVNAGLSPQVVISAKPIDEMIAASYRLDYAAVEQELAVPGTAEPSTAPQGRPVPQSERQRMVAQILGDLLGNPAIGLDEDFFDAGGNSLVAMQLITSLRKHFGVRLPMRRFFADPTIRGIAMLIDEASAAADGAGTR